MIETHPLALIPFVQEVTGILQRTLPENTHIMLDAPDAEQEEPSAPLTVKADPARIQQALINLALNAQDAMPEGGELRIGLERI